MTTLSQYNSELWVSVGPDGRPSFGPLDGVDVYLAGLKGCPRPSHKSTATDRVERAHECGHALPIDPPALSLAGRVRPFEAHPLHAKPLVDHMTSFSRPYDLIAVVHVPDTMPYMPEPPAAVPLPASGLLLAVACAVLMIANLRKTVADYGRGVT